MNSNYENARRAYHQLADVLCERIDNIHCLNHLSYSETYDLVERYFGFDVRDQYENWLAEAD